MKESPTLEFTPQDIPDYAVRNLAMAAYELTQNILRQPGGREMLDRITSERKAAEAKSSSSKPEQENI